MTDIKPQAATTEAITDTFNLVASGYDSPALRFFPFCADRMVDKLQPRPGDKLLDVATGTGMVAISAARVIGPSGRVHGIDLAEKMLDSAFANSQRMGLDNIDLHVMDATTLEFRSRYFDKLSCAFGIFFLPDMLVALKEWLRVLKPGGKLIFSTFAAPAFQPLADLFRQQLEAMGVELSDSRWQRLTTEEACATLLEQAGFTNIRIEKEQMGYHLAGSGDWWEVLWNSGFRGYLEALSTEQLATFRSQHQAAVEKLVTDKGLWLDVETLFSTANRSN